MEDHNEKNNFPQYYDFSKRREISRGTALLTTEERNKLINKKCVEVHSLIQKYNSGNRGHILGHITADVNFICRIRGIKNKFIENQISRLNFEIEQFVGVTVYMGDPRGLKIAVKTIENTITSIIEELTLDE